MGRERTKVKGAKRRKYRAQITKTVTLRFTSIIEVEAAPGRCPSERRRKLYAAIAARLQAEIAAKIERNWSMEKVDENCEFSIEWGSIEEVAPHIETIPQ